jgi:hypothetical protein
MSEIRFPLHFLLLASAVFVLIALHMVSASSLRPLGWNISVWGIASTVYGALHGSAVVASLRARSSLRRCVAFLLLAALLSYLVPWLGLFLLGSTGLFALPVASSLGAVTYALLIRFFWLRRLSWSGITVIAIACAAATMLPFLLGHGQSSYLDIWLTVLWWFTFSGILAVVSTQHSWRLTMRWSGS